MNYPIFPSILTNPPNSAFRWPIHRTHRFATLRQVPVNLRNELTIGLATYPIWDFEWDLSYIKGDETTQQAASAYQALVGFAGQVQGGFAPWLFPHPYDNTIPVASKAGCTNTISGGNTGDGSTTIFQMTRQIGVLQDLIQNFNGSPVIYLNGAVQNNTTYSIDQFGNLIFNSAPGSGVSVQWSGAFYYLCKFDEDSWKSLEESMYQIWSLGDLKFHTVLL